MSNAKIKFKVGDIVEYKEFPEKQYIISNIRYNITSFDPRDRGASISESIESNKLKLLYTKEQLNMMTEKKLNVNSSPKINFKIGDIVTYANRKLNNNPPQYRIKSIKNGKCTIETVRLNKAYQKLNDFPLNDLQIIKTYKQIEEEKENIQKKLEQSRVLVQKERNEFKIENYENVKNVNKNNLKTGSIIKMNNKIYKIIKRDDPPQWKNNEDSLITLEDLSNGSKKTLDHTKIIRSESKIVKKIQL